MKKLLFIGFILSLAIVGGWIATKFSRVGVATPKYSIIEKLGDFEIRDYPQLTIATTGMGEQKELNGSFGRLFRYISGQNAEKMKIAMTTPVLMDRSGTQKSMSFILPESLAPTAPLGERDVQISTIPPGRFAVFRFSTDGRTPSDDKVAADRLENFVKTKGLSSVGEVIVAYYDPPWIPSLLRRNEVLMRLR